MTSVCANNLCTFICDDIIENVTICYLYLSYVKHTHLWYSDPQCITNISLNNLYGYLYRPKLNYIILFFILLCKILLIEDQSRTYCVWLRKTKHVCYIVWQAQKRCEDNKREQWDKWLWCPNDVSEKEKKQKGSGHRAVNTMSSSLPGPWGRLREQQTFPLGTFNIRQSDSGYSKWQILRLQRAGDDVRWFVLPLT